MVEFTKRNNYVDGQFVDIDDFQTEQNYFLEKIRSITNSLATNGVVDLSGLIVSPDTTMTEPVFASSVAVPVSASPDPNAPNPQNFSVFPNSFDPNAESFQFYNVFLTNTTNIQRFDLKVTLDQVATAENLDLIVRVLQLVDGTNPASPLSSAPPLVEIQLSQQDIPAADSDEFITIDVSNQNSGQGVSVVNGIYYALQIEYRRPVGSTSNVRVFHSPLDQLSDYSDDIFSYFFTGTRYSQSYSDTDGLDRRFVTYHKVHTSAIKVGAGEAIINGERTIVEQDQFKFLEIPDRRNVDQDGLPVNNFVVLRYLQQFTDEELLESSRNPVNTRIKDTSSVEVLTQPQWDALVADQSQTGKFLLLATITDSNIVSIFDKQQFTIPSNSTNLAFEDWLNPSNSTPVDEAVAIQEARPSDFVFFVSNVPAQVPLADSFGNIQLQPATIRDEFGNIVARAGDPILDDIVRVVVNITLDNGKNTRTLELSQVSEIGTAAKFRNYAATISNLFDNPFDDVFTFNFNTDQLAPNVTYNFVAFTQRGLPIYIQDYNRTIGNVEVDGSTTSLREGQYTVFLNRDSLTATIEQDLQLGAFNPASDSSQPGVVQYVPTLIETEILTPVGTGQTETVTLDDLVDLDPNNSFLFTPPMSRADQVTKVINTDLSVQAASDAGDLTVLVDLQDGNGPVDVTFSGTTNRDRGGNGAAVLIQGTIDSSVVLPSSTELEVKVRNLDGKDNTNTSSDFNPVGPALVGGSGNVRAFNLIARGQDLGVSPLNTAGFVDGDQVYVFIGDRQALDLNFQPITFTFDSNQTSVQIDTIQQLGPQKYFREKQIKSIESSTSATPGVVLVDTGLDSSNSLRPSGQIIFNRNEIPTAIEPNAEVSLQYNSVIVAPQDIDYYKTQFAPIGTRDGFKVENTNVVSSADEFISVPEAIALTTSVVNQTSIDPATYQSVAFFVDGINITSLLSPIGQKEVVADNGIALQPGQVAFNPDTGALKFYKQVDGYSTIVSEAPDDFTRITASYFKLETKFVFNTSTTASYEPKFDINNDGRIDELDLSVVNSALGSVVGDPNYIAAADFNNDGAVDNQDLELFQQHFGAVSLGEPDYSDATSARLKALLVAKQDNFLNTLEVVKAVSKPADSTAPNGRTVLFFDSSTPVEDAGNYTVTFGFQAAMSLGFIQAEIETDRPLNGILNLENIKMFESVNPANTREIIQVEASTLENTNNRFNSVLTFSPAINQDGEFTIRSLWDQSGIAIKNAKDLVISQKYELLDRKKYGPFKLSYTNSDFDSDGTSIEFVLKAEDATLADGSPDLTGRHIDGIPLSELTFTIHLTARNQDGTNSLWTWHDVQPLGTNNKIKLEFNNNLFIDHRTQGKDGAQVLTPFGLGVDQVSLKPTFAGGDLANDLANISVLRSDIKSQYVKPHQHTSERDGGILTSRTIQFADDLARFNLEEADVTDAIYNLLDITLELEEQIELIKSLEGAVRWDRGLFWDSPDTFWDS